MSDNMITRSIIVKADVEKAYEIWSNFELFPMFMENIKTVKRTGERTSHWEMKGPLGVTLEWEAETTRLEPNKRVAWSTKEDGDSDLTTSGQVTFTPLPDNETQVTVMLQYVPKAGLAGEVVDKLFSHPEDKLEQDLRNFKAYIEGMYDRTA